MNHQQFEQRIAAAKKAWPEQVSGRGGGESGSGSGDAPDGAWADDLAHLLLRSRRRGLAAEEARRWDALVRDNLVEVLELGDRWLVSIADTYAESATALGDPEEGGAWRLMLVLSALRMVEKLSAANAGCKDLARAAVLPRGADIHRNLARRLRRGWEGTPHLRAIFLRAWRGWAEDPETVVGGFNQRSAQDLAAEAEAAR